MSYMRGEQYLWSDGDRLHIWIADGYDGYDGWDEAGWACDADGKRSAERKNGSQPEKRITVRSGRHGHN